MRFNFSFNNKIQSMGTKGTILALILTLLMGLITEYLYLIPVSIKNPSFIVFLIILLVVFVSLDFSFTQRVNKWHKPIYGLIAVLAIYVFGGYIMGHPIFHAEDYRNQLVIDENANFYEDNENISFDQIPVVDRASATRLGDRKMGEIRDYVSQFDVSSDYTQINYQGRPVRVTPLNYSGIVKWFNNFSEGLPAYIIVDMVSQEADIVRLENKMKYSESDKFFRNIYRYLFIKYPTLMFEEVSFEIDENGVPYYVAPVYEYEIGLFRGKDIVGTVLVNACDGEHQYYDINEVPGWLDRIYPESLVMDQLTNWGQYTNGFWNVYFGQKDVLQPTEGYNYITIDDDVYFYTGLTSVMADESNVGFALINLRTKEAKFYNIPGAEEYSAQNSAQGEVQDLGYIATFPILINCGGEPTYFMALKDGSDLVKQYAFVSVQNYNVVATGTSISEAQKNYFEKLSAAGGKVEIGADLQTKTGIVADITSVVVEGNTRYYFTLVDDSMIYIAPVSLSDLLPLTKIGDQITIEYFNSEMAQSVIISSFEK